MKKNQLTYSELSSFFENTGTMLQAGIAADEAISLLLEETNEKSPVMRECLSTISEELSGGAAFADAVKKTGCFPDYSVNMLDAAEYVGTLDQTLMHLGEYYRNEESISKTLGSAVRYPIVLLSMIIALLAVMLAVVFPAFRDVYANLSGDTTAGGYLDTSFVICIVLLAVMAALVVILICGLVTWRRGNRNAVRNSLGRFKSFARIFEGFGLYRFTTCFSMFMASGSMQDDAVKKSIPVVEASSLKEKIERCSAHMDGGMSFSQAARDENLYEPSVGRLLVPAERSGKLDVVLKKVISGLKEKNEENVARISNTVEPVLTGVLLIAVGLILISLMIPLVGIMNSIG